MAEKKKHVRIWPRILLGFLGLLIVIVLGFVIWGSTPAKPMPEALSALQSDPMVHVETGKWLVFNPLTSQPTTGFIFYPGGRVDYRAYAPAAHQIAAQGYLVVIVPMPLNLAVFNPAAAADVIAAFPEIQHWAVGGHSLGGSMAANFAHSQSGKAQGLVLWASYPAGSDDLSSSVMKVLSISGTLDGLSTPTKIEASQAFAVWLVRSASG
jgi:acetyl esterase/lipase